MNDYQSPLFAALFSALREACTDDWRACVDHEFARRLGPDPRACARWPELCGTCARATRLEAEFRGMGLMAGA